MQINDQILYSISELQSKHPNVYIGGSISLILQNIIPLREVSDIDLVTNERVHIYDIFNVDKEKHFLIRKYYSNNVRNELFINPNAKYIDFNYSGFIIKLSPVDETIEWKKKFYEKTKKEKHLRDIKYYDKIK